LESYDKDFHKVCLNASARTFGSKCAKAPVENSPCRRTLFGAMAKRKHQPEYRLTQPTVQSKVKKMAVSQSGDAAREIIVIEVLLADYSGRFYRAA